MARDRIAELLLIRQRAGKYKRAPSTSDLDRLKDIWDKQLKGIDPTDELIPIRIVTILEVFIRHWVETLIDHGAPYVERVSKLKVDVKYDFAIVRSLQGGSVSLGQLIAHSLSVSRVDAFSAVLGTLLDQDLFDAISKTRDRWKAKHEGDAVGPIINDMPWVRRTLARLFEVRHILVHELPEKKPHRLNEIAEFLDAASLFLDATDEELWTRLGGYPMSQAEMNSDAARRHKAAMYELEMLCKEIDLETPEIHDVQRAWLAFKEAEAERQTQRHLGGSIRPMIYSLAAEAITRNRIQELRDWLDNRMD
jgi:Lysozyme inhibitor LprI